MFRDHQTNHLLFLSVTAHMTNCWHLLFQITHIKYYQQYTIYFILQSLLSSSTSIQQWSKPSDSAPKYFYWHHSNFDANQVVLTLLQLCDNRVSKCYGCQWPIKNGVGFPFPPPCDIIAVAKMKRGYRKEGILCEAPPSNVYFHVFHENPLFHHSLAFKRS